MLLVHLALSQDGELVRLNLSGQLFVSPSSHTGLEIVASDFGQLRLDEMVLVDLQVHWVITFLVVGRRSCFFEVATYVHDQLLILPQVLMTLKVFCVCIRQSLVHHLQPPAALEIDHLRWSCIACQQQHLGLDGELLGTYSVFDGRRPRRGQIPLRLSFRFHMIRAFAALVLFGAQEQRLPLFLVRLKLVFVRNVFAFHRRGVGSQPLSIRLRVRQS